MRLQTPGYDIVRTLATVADDGLALSRARWERLTPRQIGLCAAAIAAVAVVTGELRPLPWQLHLLVPVIVGVLGWAIARRWGDRPAMVLWGMLGLFVGISAAQRLETAILMPPLALVGTLTGLCLGMSSEAAGDDQADSHSNERTPDGSELLGAP